MVEPPPGAALAPGAALHGGAYTVTGVLGRGGFGITYRARVRDAKGEGGEVAIKECFPSGCRRALDASVRGCDAAAQSSLERLARSFADKARQLRGLDHPSIAAFLDSFAENGTSYLVMELVEGPTLAQQVEGHGPLQPERALEVARQLGGALDHIHHSGLLHLDVKPENVILRPLHSITAPPSSNEQPDSDAREATPPELAEGALAPDSAATVEAIGSQNGKVAAVLIDFDLLSSRELGGLDTRPLALATRVGTPGYAPIEQYAESAPLSPATDFYALGATLLFALTARAPLAAPDRAAGVPWRVGDAFEGLKVEDDQSQALARWKNALGFALEVEPPRRPGTFEALEGCLIEAPLPDEPDDENSPRFAVHAQGVYRVVLKVSPPVMPGRCVCCATKKPDSQWLLRSPSGRWQMPLCGACAHHQDVARQANAVTLWGTLASIGFAVLCVTVSIVTSSVAPVLLGVIAMMLNFSAMSYGALKNSRAGELLSDFCADLSEPATYLYNGRVHVWRFKNERFADEFKRLNADHII